jgi:hypothetical protein
VIVVAVVVVASRKRSTTNEKHAATSRILREMRDDDDWQKNELCKKLTGLGEDNKLTSLGRSAGVVSVFWQAVFFAGAYLFEKMS